MMMRPCCSGAGTTNSCSRSGVRLRRPQNRVEQSAVRIRLLRAVFNRDELLVDRQQLAR